MLHNRPGIARGQNPRCNVRIMIEPRDKHFIAGVPCSCQGSTDSERQRRHVRAEDGTGRIIGAKKVRRGLMSRVDNRITLLRHGENAAAIRVGCQQIPADGVGHGLRYLTARGAIKIGHRSAMFLSRQRRELSANPVKEKGGHGELNGKNGLRKRFEMIVIVMIPSSSPPVNDGGAKTR